MVLACVIATDASMCIEATDERGPYETREECVMRVHQMVATLQMTMPVLCNIASNVKSLHQKVSNLV